MTGGGSVMTTSASEMHMRRIGLATRNQSALFTMSGGLVTAAPGTN